jgi:dopamine beta-monooxygenase
MPGPRQYISLPLFAILAVRARPDFAERIPNGGKVPDAPGVGHVRSQGGGARNAFGRDFASAGLAWTTELCQKDSDGDGRSNGAELGDPECVWTPGATPAFTTGITHPGVDGASALPLPADTCEGFDAPPNNVTIELRLPSYRVPAQTTTYAKLAFNTEELIGKALGASSHGVSAFLALRLEAVVEHPEVVHHMLLYACAEKPSQFVDEPVASGRMPCHELRYAWAVGGGPFCTPDKVGIAFESDRDKAWHVLEIHYNNEAQKAGITDSSGVRLLLIPEADEYERAGFLWSAARLKTLSIPPGRDSFHVAADCQFAGLPASGVTAAAYMLHAHQLGRAIWTQLHGPGGEYLHDVGCNTRYDFNSQEILPLLQPTTILPSHRLQAHCVYDSTGRQGFTTGGESTSEEKCITLLLYHPKAEGVDTQCWTDARTVTDPPAAQHDCCPLLEDGPACDPSLISASASAPAWLYVHSVFMVVAFGALAPLGVACASPPGKLRLGASWLHYHRSLQIGASCGVLAAAIAAMAGTGMPPNSLHSLIGILIVGLMLVQPALGILRPHAPALPAAAAKSRARIWWERVHKSLGRAILALALANAALGGIAAMAWEQRARARLALAVLPFTSLALGIVTVTIAAATLHCRDRSGSARHRAHLYAKPPGWQATPRSATTSDTSRSGRTADDDQ